MMTPYEIPLSPTAQRFTITLGGIAYQMILRWCPPALTWVLDILDAAGNPLVQGQPLVTGADLLGQLQYLGIPGDLLVQSDFDPNAVPTSTNLGLQSHLYFLTAP
jgi:hypothetical protein